MRQHHGLLLVILTALVFCAVEPVAADTVCLKASSRNGRVTLKKRVVSGATCPRGFTNLINTTTLTGPQGADGSLRIYGTADAADASITSNTSLTGGALIYNNFTVQDGVTLTVDSGTIIRCYGTFTNNGTINVKTAAKGVMNYSYGDSDFPSIGVPHPGIAHSAAGLGETGDTTGNRVGGDGAYGLTEQEAAMLRYPGPNAGGGAAGVSTSNFGFSSVDGGGSLVVLARGGIINNGVIHADGATSLSASGYGGGGGGILILASPVQARNNGIISANGGNGANATATFRIGGGGGGGGGIIHFISPEIVAGLATATKGSGGTAAVRTNTGTAYGGGGGGACGGNGGLGGMVQAVGIGTNIAAGQAGDDGYVISTTSDPTSLF